MKKEQKWIYQVISFDNTRKKWIEAKSLIDAARKFLKKDVVKRGNWDWHPWECVVYKFDINDRTVPYSESYYMLKK